MKNNLLCLDFDDCIYPSPSPTRWCNKEIALSTLSLNFKKLDLFLENNNASVFITSSWSCLFDYYKDTKMIVAKDTVKHNWDQDNHEGFDTERQAYNIMINHLNGKIVGISQGNRDKDIIELAKHYDKIVVFDDFDLSDTCDQFDNVYFERVTGCLNNDILWRSDNFFNNKKIIHE